MNNEKGFSLIELIATIIVLGLIASTTIYVVQRKIEKVKINGFKEDLRAVIRAAEIYKEDNDLSDFNIEIRDLELKNMYNFSGDVILSEGVITLVEITNGKYCGNGTSENLKIEKGMC